jgi:hypothetical protein
MAQNKGSHAIKLKVLSQPGKYIPIWESKPRVADFP